MADSSTSEFHISRIYDVPLKKVWEAWTRPDLLARWWGPKHFINPVCRLEVRPGGSWRIVMQGPEGGEHPAKGEYREVKEMEKLVMTIDHSELADAWHDLMSPDRDKSKGRPKLEVLMTVTFEELQESARLTIRLRFESPELKQKFLKMGMAEGWSQSLDKLADLLGPCS